jgi:hypothetical protein
MVAHNSICTKFSTCKSSLLPAATRGVSTSYLYKKRRKNDEIFTFEQSHISSREWIFLDRATCSLFFIKIRELPL